MASEFRVEESRSGYRVALYRNGKYDVTFVNGLTLAAAKRQARSLTLFWQRIQAGADVADGGRLKPAS